MKPVNVANEGFRHGILFSALASCFCLTLAVYYVLNPDCILFGATRPNLDICSFFLAISAIFVYKTAENTISHFELSVEVQAGYNLQNEIENENFASGFNMLIGKRQTAGALEPQRNQAARDLDMAQTEPKFSTRRSISSNA
jgi:hypothetical protein